MIYYISFIFMFKIDPKKKIGFYLNQNLKRYYKFSYTVFYNSITAKFFRIGHTFLRDIIPLVILFIFNISLVLTLKKTVKRKIRLNSNRDNQNQSVSTALKAQKNNMKIIIYSGLNFIIGHFWFVLLNFSWLIPITTNFWSCFHYICNIFIYSSYLFNTVLYFIFNKFFRRQTLRNIKLVSNRIENRE